MPRPELPLAIVFPVEHGGEIIADLPWPCHCGHENQPTIFTTRHPVCCEECRMEYKVAVWVSLTPKEEG